VLALFLAAAVLQDEAPADGLRSRWAGSGLSVELRAVYAFQAVASGGIDGTPLEPLSSEDDAGNTASLDFALELETAKAGLWEGGFFAFRLDARLGRSVLERAGTVSAVNLDALVPNVVDRFDEETLAITEFSYAHELGGGFSLFGGLLNTWAGDENELAGSAMSARHFLNGALLYSAVEDATVPNVAPGGGVEWAPSDDVAGSFSIFASEESAGDNPFDADGFTFSTEWTFRHVLGERGGAQTIGVLYGGGIDRTDLAADPRLVLARLLAGLPVPTTSDSTWAVYYNAHQYVQGDGESGWGVFVRVGVSDGDPNPIGWNFAAGAGGRGLLPGRGDDTWGAGLFVIDLSDEDLLQGLGLDRETGAEAYYTLALSSAFRLTLDAQVIDSGLPTVDTTWILGLRTTFEF
jgi:porin